MTKELNKVLFTGRLGADPEMRFTPQGHAVTTFRVASNRSWRSSDGESHEDTEWFRVVAWNKLAEVCNQYLVKGMRVYVEGRLQTRQWQNQEGETRYNTEVIASDMIILEARRELAQPAEEVLASKPSAVTSRPTPRSAVSAPAVTPAARTSSKPTTGARAASVSALPRGKAAFEEEDLPF